MQPEIMRDDRYDPVDALVAGGGMAGIAAAIAAARNGARTLLVEAAGWLGGMGIVGATGLHSFFNVYAPHEGAQRTRLVAGIAQELIDRTAALGGAIGHVELERGGDFVSMLTPVEPECFKLAAAQLAQEAGVTLVLHTVVEGVEGVEAGDGHIQRVTLWNKRGRSAVAAKQFIDCTGDGDLSAYAGAEHIRFSADDPGAYSAGFTFRLCNVDLRRLEADLERKGLITQLAHAVKPGQKEPDLVRLGIDMGKLKQQGVENAPHYFLSSSLRPREITYCNCINYGPNDGTDVEALTQAEVSLREQMLGIGALFREQFDGCQEAYVAVPAPLVGQRRTRAVRCKYEMTREDCVVGRRFDDAIACYGFIDNAQHCVEGGGYYQIPYRALIPRGMDNLLIAGRMMTVDKVAHNSTRNTVCCLACGQAAGTAAALAAKGGIVPSAIDTEALRETLREQGVLLEGKAA